MLLFELHKFFLFYERGTGPSEETVLYCFLIWEDEVSLEREDVEQTFAPGWVERDQSEFDGLGDISTCWQSRYGAAESWRSRIVVCPSGSQFMVGTEFSTVRRAMVAGEMAQSVKCQNPHEKRTWQCVSVSTSPALGLLFSLQNAFKGGIYWSTI